MIMKCTFFLQMLLLFPRENFLKIGITILVIFPGLLHCNYFKKGISLYWSKQLQWDDFPEERRETWLKTYALPRILIR